MSLSNKNKEIQSPFKFLDSFVLKDKDYFFGRNKEIELLYDYVNKNRLVMVYGESGTGKTSLVQCGLASRFDFTDWYPIFIKRGENINDALDNALKKASKGQYEGDVINGLQKINTKYLRPVFLIFDQLEELLILGDPEKTEEKKFIRTISDILDHDQLSCNIILIIRNEYLAQLYNFEKQIPFLFDRRLHVEPMSFGKVSEVITKSCDSFNITLEKPEKNIKLIIENISGGKSRIPLPYLQVYLDMLYREDLVRTYNDNIPDDDFPHLDFTSEEIQTFGTIKNVLEKFLIEQEQELYSELQALFPDKVQSDTVRKVLDTFVTEDGTKKALSYIVKDEKIQITDKAHDFLQKLDPLLLNKCLPSLEDRRILRSSESTFELAHDSLAELIDQNRSNEQRLINQYKLRIKNAYGTYKDLKEFLSEKQLIRIDEFQSKLDLDEKYIDFIQKSWEDVRKKKKEKREQRIQNDIAEEKAQMALQTAILAQQKTRTRTKFLIVLGVLTTALAIGAFQLYTTSNKLRKQSDKLSIAIIDTKISNAVALKNQGAYSKANERLQETLGQTMKVDQKHKIDSMIVVLETLESLTTEGDSLFNIATEKNQIDKFPKALELYNLAYQQDTSIRLIVQTKEKINYRIDEQYRLLKKAAISFFNKKDCKWSRYYFNEAFKLNKKEQAEMEVKYITSCSNKNK